MIVVMFIILAFNYILLPVMFIIPEIEIMPFDWSMLYIAVIPRIIWIFGLMAGGVFWSYKRMALFWLNLVGFICFYAPLIKLYM